MTSLSGIWQMVRAELDGETAPELVAQRTLLELTQNSYRVSFDGAEVDEGSCEYDAVGNLSSLVLHGRTGANGGRTIRAIYQHVGDRLRVCYGLDGVMPTSFSTHREGKRYLATYRRIS
jgi:uncharacterized protein (TIGR03067 family)